MYKYVNGQLVEVTQEEIDSMPPDPTEDFDVIAGSIQQDINRLFSQEAAALKGSVLQEEVDTFDTQKEEAVTYLADNTADVPLLTGLATIRSIEVADLAARVLAHADAYKTAMGQIMGKKHKLEDQLKTAKILDDLAAIEVV